MKMIRSASGLMIPVEKKPNSQSHPNGIPQEERFTDRIFKCHYKSDVDKFIKYVESEGGFVCGTLDSPFRNIWNNPVGFGSYVIVYQFNKDIEMEVLC